MNDDPNANRSEIMSYLTTEEAFLETGVYEINFSAQDLDDMTGFQFTLDVNPLRAQMLNVKPNTPIMTDKNISTHYMDRGLMSCSWDTRTAVDAGELLFTVMVNVVEPSWVSDCLLYTSPSPRDQRGSRMPSSA